MRVLLVEDDRALADVVARGLRREGVAVDLALEGTTAIQKAEVNAYDVVILDRDLPGVHGDDVCREIANIDVAPRIIMLTASGTLDDRVEGLSLGADDYLPKPFAMRELVARTRALARRPSAVAPVILSAGDIRLDPGTREVRRGGRLIHLTRKEFGVLEALLVARGRVLSAEELLERVWDEQIDPFTNAVRVTIMTLRRKLGEPAVVRTVAGSGYRIGE